jgi:low affinity Fe/Cu permease
VSERSGKRTTKRGIRKPQSAVGRWLERASRVITDWTGSSWAFAIAASVILTWILTGPLFHYSDTWQLVINTGTTIVTFLMVFLIQRSQNKDSLAVQLKLNELVAAVKGASNRLIDVEDLSEEELRQLHRYYEALATMAKKDATLGESHSVEEAQAKHHRKRRIQAELDREPGEVRKSQPVK